VDEGMMRFVTGQYAPLMESSAMLGYVYDGDIFRASSGIYDIIREKESILKLKTIICDKYPPCELIRETRHALGERSFTIYHLFLDVSGESTKSDTENIAHA